MNRYNNSNKSYEIDGAANVQQINMISEWFIHKRINEKQIAYSHFHLLETITLVF